MGFNILQQYQQVKVKEKEDRTLKYCQPQLLEYPRVWLFKNASVINGCKLAIQISCILDYYIILAEIWLPQLLDKSTASFDGND